ncbi:rhomboid family intramembrane serine protease [Youhaiella tibetensis]|nr:rhomboid family intramembrane serine protease [Youhaiella tibetensis]AKR57266.1 rhomboid family serine protease [Devosia sp. H5989]GGF44382.1 rhomboid family intramembrane serine protease [Youhaiella tibetensis]
MFLPIFDENPKRHIKYAVVTYTLIAINVLVFLITVALPRDAFETATIEFGMIPIVVRGLVAPPLAWLPAWANLETYAFLHIDWLHLLSNMLFLWIFGDNIEDAMGHVRYIFFYLACAALAALIYLAFNPMGNGPLIGASGAVAGVMGAYIVLFPHARVIVIARIWIPVPLPLPAFWMLGVWVLMQIFYLLIGSTEPVAWWAHLGGVVAGALLATILKRRDVPLWGGSLPR